MSKKLKVGTYRMLDSGSQIERITDAFKKLELNGAALFWESEAQRALKEHLTSYDFLENLLVKVSDYKEDSRIIHSIKQAKFPYIKTLKDFDFYSKNLEKIDIALIKELSSCRFIDKKQNIIFLGGTGVGKTHLSISIGMEAINGGKVVLFRGLRELITAVNKIRQDVERERRLEAALIRPDVLILDEMGLYNSNPKFSDFIFRILIRRYENGNSVIFTSNMDMGKWGQLFGNEERAAAIMDRILERHEVVIIEGKSYRMDHKNRPEDKAGGVFPYISGNQVELTS